MNRWSFLLFVASACDAGSLVLKGGMDTSVADTGPIEDSAPDTGVETGEDTDTGEDTAEDSDTGTDTDTGEQIDADIVVDCGGGADFSEIQEAINHSVSGDVIGVKACTYHERLDFLGKAITVYGIDGSAETVLDADGGGTALNIETGEGAGTRFAGFTIVDGYDETNGSAVEVSISNLEMEDVVLTNNGLGQSVIEILGGWVDLTDVTITDNDINEGGQAIRADGGSFTAERLSVDCGDGSAAIYAHVSLLLDTSTLNCDGGSGIENYHGEIWMQRSTVTGGTYGVYTYDEAGTPEDPDDPNEAMYIYNSALGGGSIGVYALYEDVRIVNSVLWGADSALSMTACNTESYAWNSVFTRSACGITGDQPFTERYNAYWDNAADGCGVTVAPEVSADPMFVDFPDDFRLESDSPLEDAGDPSAGYDDVDGSKNDIGVFGGPWGSDW